MNTLKIILSVLAGIIIVGLIAGFILIRSVRKSGVPVYQGDVAADGLVSGVTVIRDERGMPHIYAANDHDLYFATGYVMAQERMWQMDLIRRATAGRLSELFGEGYVQTDLFLRALDMTSKSKKLIATEDTLIMKKLSAFCDGVNIYMKQAEKNLPPEFRLLNYKPEPWKLEDVINLIGFMGWDLASGNLEDDIFNYRVIQKLGAEKAAELIPDWKADTTCVYPGFMPGDKDLKETAAFVKSAGERLKSLGLATFMASNNWVVSGKKTETGKPLFSNDMHLGLNSPGVWMQIHQVVPGELNVTGVALPGAPFVVAGHNEKIAWGMTNLMVDNIDLFNEKINPDNKDQYYFNGGWKDMEIRKELIKIKGGKSDTLEIRRTHRGPVISDFNNISDAVLSMRWSGFDISNETNGVYKLDRASNWEEFRSAISNFGSISQNFAYADTDGNIGLNTGGGVPVRKGNGSIIRDGTTDEYDWKGYVPFDELPWSYDPECGYVSSANNKTVCSDFPYYISYRFYVPYRISRIREMLTEKEVLSTADFRRMITDQHSSYSKLLTPHILKLASRRPQMTDVESEALSRLESWDYDLDKDEAAPAVFELVSRNLARNLLGDELGDLYNEMPKLPKNYYIFRILETGPDRWVDDINTPEVETLDDIIFRSFRDGVKALTGMRGTDVATWTWGSIHKITLEHPLGTKKILNSLFKLNSPVVGIGGSDHTVCPYTYNDMFYVTDGASERHIYNTANWDESLTVIPTGASGVPASEFYLSQTGTYLRGEFYKDLFSEEAVRAAAKFTLSLRPSPSSP